MRIDVTVLDYKISHSIYQQNVHCLRQLHHTGNKLICVRRKCTFHLYMDC